MMGIFYPVFIRLLLLGLLCFFSLDLAANYDATKLKHLYGKYDQANPEQKPNDLFGLHIRDLVEKTHFKTAKGLLEKKLLTDKGLSDVIHLWLAKIAIKEKKWRDFRRHFGNLKGSLLLKNASLMREIYDSLTPFEKTWFVGFLVKTDFFNHEENSQCPYFELPKRKTRAFFTYALLANHRLPAAIKNKVLFELFLAIPEAIDDNLLKKVSGFDRFYSSLSPADLVKRMDLLLTFGKNLAARNTYLEAVSLKKKLSNEELCELAYADAKVDRKLRKYDLARKRFADLATTCPQELRRKARYMDLWLGSQAGDEKTLPAFLTFVADYPNDPFADDVLMFKANLLLEKERRREALDVLEQVIKQYPTGDMVSRALFLRSFILAQDGSVEKAIASFRDLAKATKNDDLDHASATYWIARLSIFNDVNSLKNPKKANIPKAQKALRDLVHSDPPSVYSWLAFSLLESIGEKVVKKPKNPGSKNSTVNIHNTNDRDIAYSERLLADGFREEALLVLDDLAVDQKTPDRAESMAILYDLAHRPEAGHQKLVRCNPTLGATLTKKLPDILAHISFPRPFVKEIERAVSRVDISPSLILAVMRQESGFLKDACSWAGAKGLMQLMFPSAEAQRKALMLEGIKEDDLYVPELNLLLATSLLKKYWQQFSSLPVGLAAYNAGPSRVKGWLKKAPSPPVDTFIESIALKDTRSYVKSVLGNTFEYASLDGFKSLPTL